MHKNPVARALAAVTVGQAVIVENLVMFPLLEARAGSDLDRGVTTLDYVVLDDAIGTGLAEITELSQQGSVPELRFINRGPHPVLIIDGEELLGAKQNRVVNLTILAPAHSTLTIPVSCVEAGRWRARSKSFASAPRTQYATGRAMRVAQVTRSIVDHGARMSDQAAVWADIAEKSRRMVAITPTSAMESIFNAHAASLDTYVAGCTPADGQVGALFAIGDRIIGFDLFDRATTFRKLMPKLVRSYAIDALDARGLIERGGADLRKKADRRGKATDQESSGFGRADGLAHIIPGFLGAVTAAAQQRATAVGTGTDVRITANGLVGAALIVGDDVVHLGAFCS
jgi:hypothetical protein